MKNFYFVVFKKIIAIVFVVSLFANSVFAQNANYYQSFVILNSGSGNTYYDAGVATVNADFNGNNLGTYTCNGTLVLNGGETDIRKGGTCDVTGSKLAYRVYLQGSTTLPAFSEITLPFSQDFGSCFSGNTCQRWLKNNAGINLLAGLTDGIYKIDVYFVGATQFCSVGLFYDSNSNNDYSATFTINNPITITSSPTPPTVCFGSSTSISASATGSDAFIWQKQNGANWDNLSIAGATGSLASGATTTLNLSNVTTTEIYRCLFTNCGGLNTKASDPVTVTSQRPVISVQPASQADCDGNDIIFNVTASGTGTLTYQWQKKLPGGSFTSVTGDANITVNAVSGIKVENIGNAANPHLTEYRCIITDGNTCPLTSDVAVMTVNKITTSTLASQTICEGGNATYTLTTEGTTPSFQWQKRTGLAGTWANITNGGVFSNATTNALTITGATFATEHDTYYQCLVTFPITAGNDNGAGTMICTTTSDNARLVVIQSPNIPTHSKISENGCVGIANTLNATGCSSQTPTATTEWYDANNLLVSTSADFTLTPTTVGTFVYKALCVRTVSGNTCRSLLSSGVTFRVYAIPSAPSATALPVSPVCQGVSVQLSPVSTGYRWYTQATGGSFANANATLTNVQPVDANTQATISRWVLLGQNGCDSPRTRIDVLVNPSPASPTVSTPINYCQNATTSALSATGTNTLLWYGTNASGGTSSATAPTPSAATVGTVTYYVSQKTVDNCESTRAAIAVVTNANPSAPAATTAISYCKNTTATALTATALGTNTLVWYDVNDNILSAAPTPNTSTVGTQTFKVSQKSASPANCEGLKTTIVVTINDLPAAPVVISPIGYCQNATATALSATATSPNTLLWYGTSATGGTSTASVTPLTNIAGTTSYYVSQKDANNCESPRAKIDVEITPTLTAGAISGINAFCTTGVLNNSTTLTANPTGGNGIYSYQWQNLAGNILSATNQTFIISAANTYQSVITSGYCTATTSNSAVTAQGWGDVPNITGNTPDICGSGTKTLNIVSPSSSGVYKWYIDATTLTQTASGTSFTTPNLTTTTTYYVAREQQITTNLVCQTVRTSATINVNPTPITPTIINSAGKTTFCNSESSFSLSVSCTSGNGQYRLNNGTWTAGNSVSINPTTYASTTTLNYDFKCVLNATCESSIVSTSILINPVPNAPTISGVTSICSGSSTTLTANGCTGTVIWSNGTTANTLSVSASGTYTATCTVGGCVSTASDLQTIVVNAIPSKPTISSDDADNIFCSGTSILLTANGCSGTVIWSNGVTNNNVTVSASGTYTATCTVGGCVSPASDLQTIVVNAIPSKPTISSDDADNIFCSGTSILLTANGCTGTVIWSNGTTSNTLSISASGTYTATCTVSGCVSPASDLQTIVVNAIPNAPTISGATSICSGSSTTLTANGCTGTISWNTSGAGSTISALVGTYSATCTQNSCTSMSSNIHTITENPLPTITLSVVNSLCNSATSFSLPFTVTLGSPDKYSLTSAMPNFVAITDANLPASPILVTIPAGQTGTFSFTLTQKISSTGCSKSQTFSVTILPVLTAGSIETSPTTTNCAGYNGLSIASVSLGSGGKTPYVYQWQVSTDGVNFTDISGATATTFDPDILNETNYFRRKVTDNCGEIKFSNVHQITIVPDPQITITDVTDRVLCAGQNLTLTATTSGGFGTCVPTWQSSNSASSGFTTEQTGGLSLSKILTNSTLTPIVRYFRVIYKCSGIGSSLCNDATSAVVKVTINPLPSVPTISGTSTICAGNSTTLTASGCNGNVVWSNAASTNAITVSSAGVYTAVCTNSCGTSAASNEIVVVVTVVNPPVLLGSTSICGGQNATLTASNCTGIVTWSNGSTGLNISVSPSITTSYTATCAENGCTSLVSNGVTVTVAPTVDFSVGTVGEICNSATSFSLPFTVTLGSPDKYSLTSAMPNFVAITDANLPASPILVTIPAGQTGTFSFTLTQKISSTGCSKSQIFSVTILPILTAGSIETSPTTTNCSGYNGLSIASVSLGSGGKTPYVYQWQVSTDGINFTDISGATATTFDPDILNETNYFRRKINDACGEIKFSNVHQITIVPDPQITITDVTDRVLCAGQNLTLTATTTGGFGTCVPTWQSSNSASSGFTTEQTGGLSLSKILTNSTLTPIVRYFRVIYTCSGTGSSLCNDAASGVVKVTINPLPSVPTINGTATICAGNSTTLTASGCNGNVVWSNAASTNAITVSSAGVYTAVCTNSCGTSVASNEIVVVVTVVNPPVLSGSTSICGGQNATLTASNCTGIVTWSNGSTGLNISVSPSITTSYTATCAENGCTSLVSNSVTVTVAPTVDFSVGTVGDICNSATSFSLPFTTTLGSPDKYSLTSAMPNFVAITDANLPASPILVTILAGQTGTFSFTLTQKISSTGCSKSQIFSLTILPVLTAGIIETSPTTTNCSGYDGLSIASVSLGSGGKTPYVYQWQVSTDGINFTDISGATATTFDPDILNETNYFRRKVTDNCGEIKFSNVHQITIVPDPQITITDVTDRTLCAGESLTLTATTTGGFGTCVPTWQSSNSASSGFTTEQTGGLSLSKILTNSTLTPIVRYFRVIYTCSGTGSSLCNDATSVVVKVTINPLPAVPTINGIATICAGNSTTLTASGCNGNVVWSNAASTNAITVSSAGVYTAVCTNSCGTSAASNEIVVVVTVVNPPVLLGSTSICGGQNATLTASNCTGIVTWSNGSTGLNISASPSITTSYTATCAENGCTSLVSNGVTVTVAPTVDFSVGTVGDICNSATSFSLPFTVTLGSPDKYSLTSAMPNFVAITDANLPASPILVTIPAGQTGTFSFTLTQKISSTGCSKSQIFSVTILPILTAGSIETSPTTTNCSGYNGLSIASVSLGSGGKTPYVYQWQVSTDGVNFTDISGATATTFDPDILNETNYFRRKVTDNCGEIKFSNVHQITIVPDPQITITDVTDRTLCAGESLTLTATTTGGFGTCVPTWQSSNSASSGFTTEQIGGLSLSKTLTNSILTPIVRYFRVIYTCSGTGSSLCNDAASGIVKVIINYVPTAPIITPASVIICPTQSTLLTASGCNGTVLWASGQSGSTLSVSASGTYSAICSANNCVSAISNISTVTVASGGTPIQPPTISGTVTICNGQSTNLIASSCTGLVTWSNGSTGTSISVSPSLLTNYTATCSDATCTSNASNQIIVTVNNFPTIATQPRNEADCNGNSVTFSVTSSPATAHQWQRKIPNGTFTDISGAITNSLTISDVGSVSDPNLTEYKVIVSNNSCSITSNVAILTVNSVTGSLVDKTICGGTNTTFDLTTITTTGTIQSYQWQKRVGTSGTWIDISGATATTLSINNVTNADEQYYRCKINFTVGSSTCARYTTEDDSNGAKLTVLVASMPTISGNNVVCLGKSTTLTANNCDGTISWSSGQSTASISVSPTVNTSYSVTCTSPQCGFMVSSTPYEVTVNAIVQPINTTSDVITPATLVFSANTTVANATLLWYDRPTGGTGSTTAPTFTAVGTYSYWVTQINPLTACESARLPIIAKVLDTFRITQQPATQADCKGNSVFMGVVAVGPNPAFTYQWQRKRPSEVGFVNLTDESAGIRGWFARSMAVSNVGDVNNPHLTQYRCIVGNAGQFLTTAIATLSVNSLSGSMSNLGICFGQTNEFNLQNYFTITGNVVSYQWQTRPGTSGSWTDLSNGNGISGSTTSALKFSNATYEQGVYYRCLVKFNTQGFECTEPTDAAKLIVSGFPPAPSVSNIFYCQNSTAVRLKVNSSVQNLVWYAQETGGTGSNMAPIPSTSVAGNFRYYVTDRTDEGCESPRAAINVEVGALPLAPVNTTPSTISEGSTLAFSADGLPKEGQVLRWFTSPTGTAFTTTAPTFTAAGTYTRYVAQLSAFGCLGSRTAITASIIPSLKFTKQPVSQTDCDGNSVTFSVSASSPNGLTYQWQRQKPNENIFSNIPNEIANSLTIKNIDDVENPNMTKYRCVIKDEKGSVVSDEASLTVNKIIGTLSNVSLCDGNATKLNFGSLTLQGKIASYQWQQKIGDIYTDIPTNQDGTATVNEAATYRGRALFFIDEKNTCVRTTDDLKVEIKPTPVAPQVINQAVCQNLGFSLEKSVTAANTLLWYDAVSSTTSSKITPKIDLNKVGKTTFFVSQVTQFGCESERKSFDLVVSPVPAKPTANDVSYCRNAPSIALTATTDRENTLLWYASITAKDGINSLVPDTKTDGTFNYFVSAKNTANCESERVGVKVSIAPCIATFENNFNNCVQVSTDDVKGNRWYDLYDNAGKLYASVNPNGLDLGKVSISIRHYGRGSGAIPKTQNDTKFMARYVDFQSSTLKKFEKPVSLRIFYQNDELVEYKTASNLPSLTINDFNIVHYDGKNEDCGFENNDNFNDGNSEVIYKNVVGNQLAKDFFYLQFDVNTFSENGATANDFTEITFTGKPTAEKNVQLNWQTKFEIKAEKFILERSADCKNYVALTEIKANGINSAYERFDYQPLSGKFCYRLVYIDKDGTKKYLDRIEVNFTDTAPICSVFPNPWNVGDVVNLYLRNIKEKEIKLYDMLGQAYSFDLKKDESGIIRIRPDVQLNKGMHFLVVIGEDGKRCVQKIVINP